MWIVEAKFKFSKDRTKIKRFDSIHLTWEGRGSKRNCPQNNMRQESIMLTYTYFKIILESRSTINRPTSQVSIYNCIIEKNEPISSEIKSLPYPFMSLGGLAFFDKKIFNSNTILINFTITFNNSILPALESFEKYTNFSFPLKALHLLGWSWGIPFLSWSKSVTLYFEISISINYQFFFLAWFCQIRISSKMNF